MKKIILLLLITSCIEDIEVSNTGQMITFDDGKEWIYTQAYPLMKAKGMRGNIALPVKNVGRDGYLSLDQLEELRDYGWAIVSHSMEHGDLKKMTELELNYDLITSQNYMIEKGFNPDFYIVPFHRWGQREKDAILNHYRGVRGMAVGSRNPRPITEGKRAKPSIDLNNIAAFNGDLATVDEIQEYLNTYSDVIQPVYFHNEREDFEDILNVFCNVITYNEL